MKKNFINKFFQNTLYVRIKSEQISIYYAEKNRTIEDKPIVAVKSGRNDKRIIVAVGSEALSVLSKGDGSVSIHNGFEHPRSCISDFEIAEAALREFIKRIVSKMMMVRPIIIIHPAEKLEGGLTQVEHRALRELAEASGGREVYVWCGRILDRQEILSLNFPKSGGKLGWGAWE